MPSPRRAAVRLRYFLSIARGFRGTLAVLAIAVLVGGGVYAATPHAQFGGRPPPLLTCFYGAWMAMFAQPVLSPPETWYLDLLCGIYPLIGFVVVGEGVVRLGMLMISRAQGEKEWMKVMAQAERDHIVLCGLGHLGYRILGQLVAAGAHVVALEKDPECRFLADAKATGVPVLVRNMKEDEALVVAGVARARTIIIATNDDMANLEVALDARRQNPRIRVLMRMFDQQIADKVKDAFLIDAAFSAAALAAPIVAAMSQDSRVRSSSTIGGVPHVTLELEVEAGSSLDGSTVAELELSHRARVLARTGRAGEVESPPPVQGRVGGGDRLVIHLGLARLGGLSAAAAAHRSPSGQGVSSG
jgi:Trk K+ transport system NAD-binding subunit